MIRPISIATDGYFTGDQNKVRAIATGGLVTLQQIVIPSAPMFSVVGCPVNGPTVDVQKDDNEIIMILDYIIGVIR